jgi:hypothetical protein
MYRRLWRQRSNLLIQYRLVSHRMVEAAQQEAEILVMMAAEAVEVEVEVGNGKAPSVLSRNPQFQTSIRR